MTSEELKKLRELAQTGDDAHLNNYALALTDVAYEQHEKDQSAEAEANFKVALAIIRRLEIKYPGKYLPAISKILTTLAVIYVYSIENYPQAETFVTEALEISDKLCVEDHDAYMPNRAFLINLLGAIQKETGRYAQARTNLLTSIEIMRSLGSPEYGFIIEHTQQDLEEIKDK